MKRRLLIPVLIGMLATLVAVVPIAANDAVPVEVYPLDANPKHFGDAIAIDGDTMVVGAWRSAPNGEDSGEAWVYVRDGEDWVQQARLLPKDGGQQRRFGAAVALSGDTAIIGARLDAFGGPVGGAAHVFVRTGETWTEEATLTAPDGFVGDQFGTAVAVSGSTALVGASGDDTIAASSGTAYVFERGDDGWTLQAQLLAPDGEFADWFGDAVALDGDRALVGAWGVEGGPGTAYIFARTGESWANEALLTASDGYRQNRFGYSVALDGDRALVGTRVDDDVSAYLFERSANGWTQTTRLVGRDAAGRRFGGSVYRVALAGDTAAISASINPPGEAWGGAVLLFQKAAPDWVQQSIWEQPEQLSQSSDFANGLALTTAMTVAGAPRVEHNGVWNAGSIYLRPNDLDGDGIVDNVDTDDDGDTVPDAADNCPQVANVTQLDADEDRFGDACDPDDDWDGVPDDEDAFPFDDTESTDADDDGIGDVADLDDDNDGVVDTLDRFPLDAAEHADGDGDGIGDNADPDPDNDGVCEALRWFPLVGGSTFTYTTPDGGSATQFVDTATTTIGNVATRGMFDSYDNTRTYYTATCDGVFLHRTVAYDVTVEGLEQPVDLATTFEPPIFLMTAPGDATARLTSGTAIYDFVGSGAWGLSFQGFSRPLTASTIQTPAGTFDAAPVELRLRLFGQIEDTPIDATETDTGWFVRDHGVARLQTAFEGTVETFNLAGSNVDFDGDGLGITQDNCPTVATSSLVDTDADGEGDACDLDDDGDGVVDGYDAYPLDAARSEAEAPLVAAVLPGSRSARLFFPVTAFATVVNRGAETASDCSIQLADPNIGRLVYQATDPATNEPVGEPDVPVDIEVGAAGTYVITVYPSIPLRGSDLPFAFACADAEPADVVPGVNTLALSASREQEPDIVALAATATDDGIVVLGGSVPSGAFAVASVNVGVAGELTATAESAAGMVVPLDVFVCPTDASGACLTSPGVSVTTMIDGGATPTFSVFVNGQAAVPFDPAVNRVFLRFRDATGRVRGATSVAVMTGP